MHVGYLGILIDDKVNWNTPTNNIVSKFMRGNSVLSKLDTKNNLICNIPFLSYLCHHIMGTNKNSANT